MKAGVASWLPAMIAVLGQQLGVLTLFGVKGASETGLYYVSFAIMGVVTGLGGSVLGLVGNLSRIATYIPLSYLMGGVGVALSYTIGAYIALAATALVCRRMGFNPGFKEALLITAPPLCLAPILHLLDVTWLIGTPILLLIPYTSYLKMKILIREDLRELAYALAPKQTVNEIYHHLRPIIDRLID